jgi:hypothetical protein
VNCLICGTDDGLAIMCGQHWAEYVNWQRNTPLERDPDEGATPEGQVADRRLSPLLLLVTPACVEKHDGLKLEAPVGRPVLDASNGVGQRLERAE